METSETYNNLIQVRKISQLTNINDFTNYNDEDILFVIAAHDKTLGKWANFSVNKGVLINLLNHINLDAIREEIEALRDFLEYLKDQVSNYGALIERLQALEERLENYYYTAEHIDSLLANYYTKTECDNRFQPKGNYLTEHHNTNSKGHLMKIPAGHYISGITFDDYGHVLDIETSVLNVTPDVKAANLVVSGHSLSKSAIYLGDAKPTWNNGTVVVEYTNGTSKTVTDYQLEIDWSAVHMDTAGTYQVIGRYTYVEDDVTLHKDLGLTLKIGQLDSIDVSGYGFATTRFGVHDTLTAFRKGTVTAKYTNGLANKTVTNNTQIVTYSSSNTSVISINGQLFEIKGAGTTVISATYQYTEAGITKNVTKTQSIEIVADEQYYIYVGEADITSECTTNVDPGSSSSPEQPVIVDGYKYYIGRNTEIGTSDLETTNFTSFYNSSESMKVNTLDDIRNYIKDTIDVGAPTTSNFFIIVAPTEIINEITKIETLAGKTVKKEPLTESNGYTTLLCGPFTGTQVNVIK